MPEPKVLIIGYGVVGKNLYKELESLQPDIYDKYTRLDNRDKSFETIPNNSLALKCIYPHYDFAFICVDTPLVNNNLDTSEVFNAINENNAEIYIIKSTIPVGTTYNLSMATDKRIVFSPEYYGGTPHCNNFTYDFTILGGEKQDCIEVQQLLQKCYDARHSFRITDSKTAELVKFMENSWIATKVSFCSQFYEIAKSEDINYEDLRELFILDPRVNPSHTFIFSNHPYWDSHCLNKDVPYIANTYDCAELLRDMIKFNKKQSGSY